jgi:broad specificity phosphatase PhoE
MNPALEHVLMYTETIIDLIRHGEPVGGQKLRGSLDDPLSELGWEQMRKSVSQPQAWHSIISSPLSRCRDFATNLSGQLTLPLHIEPRFQEISFGCWEGLSIKELMKTEPDALRNYWQNPDLHAPEGSEPLDDFLTRVHSAWEELIDTKRGTHQLLICHGGVIRAVLMRVLAMPKASMWNIDVPYANVSRVIYHHFPDGGRTSQLKFHQSAFPEQNQDFLTTPNG